MFTRGGDFLNMNILAWVVFGFIIGVLANAIDPRPAQGGMISAILLGIAGAVVGGFLGSILFGVGVTGFDISSMVVSVVGALLLLFVGRSFTKGEV